MVIELETSHNRPVDPPPSQLLVIKELKKSTSTPSTHLSLSPNLSHKSTGSNRHLRSYHDALQRHELLHTHYPSGVDGRHYWMVMGSRRMMVMADHCSTVDIAYRNEHPNPGPSCKSQKLEDELVQTNSARLIVGISSIHDILFMFRPNAVESGEDGFLLFECQGMYRAFLHV
eukprot:scaffold82922_cov59-Attheya_sp.AAC.1